MSSYKSTIRIPTDPYAYVEVEVEGSKEEIIETYRDFKRTADSLGGLSEKEFNDFVDEYLCNGRVFDGADKFAAMNEFQQTHIQLLKRSLARIRRRQLQVSKESSMDEDQPLTDHEGTPATEGTPESDEKSSEDTSSEE